MSAHNRRPVIDRLLDRAWCEISSRLERHAPHPTSISAPMDTESVSGTLEWPFACEALASGMWQSAGFRRTRAVREVVETLGLSDARYFARWITGRAPELLADERIQTVNDWGDPVQAPGWALGTRRGFSPTSLRYLAHALWLKQEGYVKPGGLIVEIGVGFGGLAAMNALVSGSKTILMDMPQVERAATLMLRETGLGRFIADRAEIKRGFCLISNYAFTELSTPLQDGYIRDVVRLSGNGIIVSNAQMFASGIGGRDNESLIASLRETGIDARIETASTILGPSDNILGNRMITWKGDPSP